MDELAEAEQYTRVMAERRKHHGALAAFVVEYDRRGKELESLRAELEECRRTRALGGPPPPVDKNWANANVGRPSSADDPNAPALRRDRSGGESG